jgi:hypothetical protein
MRWTHNVSLPSEQDECMLSIESDMIYKISIIVVVFPGELSVLPHVVAAVF